MNHLPFVSIIIPVYNVSEYIKDCILSIIAQDYTGCIECILVDDCSTDDSFEKISRLIQYYTGKIDFRIFRHEINKKQSAARNTGLKVAKGEYVTFVDSDDWMEPYAISSLVDILNKYPDSELVQAGSYRTDPSCFTWMDCGTWKEKETHYSDNRQWIIDTCAVKMSMIPMTPFCKLIKRSFLIDNNLFFYEGIYHEDDLWLVQLAKTLQKVSFLHKNIYQYRIRTDSTVGGGKIMHFEDRKRVWLETFKLLDKEFCPPLLIRQIEWDTTDLFEKCKDKKAKKMLVGIKIRLMRFCSFRYKIRIVRRLIDSCLKDYFK